MNKVALIAVFLTLGLDLVVVYAQDLPSIDPDSVGVTPGVPLPSGLGYFADPVNHHGLTLGIQAGLGASRHSETFGYDNLTVSTRWTPGTNKIGRRISVLAGFSDWQVPSFSNVFPDSVLTDLPDQERFAARSTNAACVGISVTILGGRTPRPGFAFSEKAQEKLEALDEEEDNPDTSRPRKAQISQERRSILTVERKSLMREFTLTGGMLTRLTGFAEETDVQAYDAFVTAAKGRGILDVVIVLHYLRFLSSGELPFYAASGSAGLFVELSDTAPAPVLGISASYGRYRYRELHDVIPEAPEANWGPDTGRFDLVLSLSGAPSQADQPTAGLGIRYARIKPSLLTGRNVFSLVFSTNFKLLPQ